MDAMSCLAPPPTSFFPAAPPEYYTDAAMARALHYSMPDHYSPATASTSSPSSSSSLLADLPYSDGTNWFASAAPAPAPLTSLTCDSVLVASDAAPRPPSTPATTATTSNKRRLGLGVAAGAGRAGKRRPRASKRAPTTYITTDPSNFRLMVQHVTGVQAEPGTADGTGVFTPTSFDASAAAALLNCPTYTGASFADALRLPSDADAATLHHRLQQQQQQQHLEQQPCFPTLDSWNVLYESAELF
ncbi:calmodulin-binding protein 25-like [Lolium rigidum]|uniref:calmodulin-binding protein 25-like n=1 Tax=Lolium rigidum TaxID=89674 RepID=UPI001F5D7D17|nr:calmodulin-binding protein 25-like [Lolium rigidum]